MVALAMEGKLDRLLVERLLEGLVVEIAGAFVEQAGEHASRAGLAGRVLRRAAAKGELERHQRHRVVLDQPEAHAARTDEVAQIDRARRDRIGDGQIHQRFLGRAGFLAGGDSGTAASGRRRLFGRQQVAGDGAPPVEPLARRGEHVLGAHRFDALRPFLNVADRLAGGERRAVPARQRELAVLSVDRFGDEARLGALELGGVDARRSSQPERGRPRRRDRQGNAGGGNGVEEEARVVERRAHVVGAGGDRLLLLQHQLAIEQRGLAAAEQMGEHFERIGLAGRGGAVRRREVAALPARLFDLLVVDDDQPARDRRRLLRPVAPARRRAGGPP